MDQTQFNRDYKITDSELSEFSGLLCTYMTRDLSEFITYGVTAEDISALRTLQENFENFPQDSVSKQELALAIENKNLIRESLHKFNKSMALRVELKHGKNSIPYKHLEFLDISRLPDDGFIARTRNIYSYMKAHKSEYIIEGLTEQLLTDMNNLIIQFDNATETANTKNTDRKIITLERVKMGNELYTIVARYCEIGKTIWDGVNPAKYENYVIYTPSAGSLKKPNGVDYMTSTHVLSWNPVLNATSYDAQYSTDGINWTDAYAGSDTWFEFIPPVEGWAYFRCRARNNNGFGEFSDVIQTGYYKTLPPPSNIKAHLVEHSDNTLELTWDLVPSANKYKVYFSAVAIGAAEGNYNLLASVKDNFNIQQVEHGKRYYYQLTAENSSQWSGRSSAIYFDVD